MLARPEVWSACTVIGWQAVPSHADGIFQFRGKIRNNLSHRKKAVCHRAEHLHVPDQIGVGTFGLGTPGHDGQKFVALAIDADALTAEGCLKRSAKIRACDSRQAGLHFGKLRTQRGDGFSAVNPDSFRPAVCPQNFHGLGSKGTKSVVILSGKAHLDASPFARPQ